jgi:hypothetical protein
MGKTNTNVGIGDRYQGIGIKGIGIKGIGISVSEIDLKIAPKPVHGEGDSRRMEW